jgi:hypothetical protein
MANIIYSNFYKLLASGTIDLTTDNIYVALLSGSYTPNTGHTLFSDVAAYESVDSVGTYHQGGSLLQGRTLSFSSNKLVFDASDVSWTPSTITASGAVMWVSGVSPSQHYLILWKDLGGNQSSTNAAFSITWNNTYGLLTLSTASS